MTGNGANWSKEVLIIEILFDPFKKCVFQKLSKSLKLHGSNYYSGQFDTVLYI